MSANTICGTVSEGSCQRRDQPLRISTRNTPMPASVSADHHSTGPAGATPTQTK
jgi:hypothetical protein